MFGACTRTPPPTTTTPPTTTLAAIPEVSARAGVAVVHLDAVLTAARAPAFAYAGKIGVAPTIRVNPGDRIEVYLHNGMHVEPNGRNDVNLHFHGLAVTPQAPSDNVLGMLAHPGQTLHYVVAIPKNHEPGLYWYHPHVHGWTFWQVAHGMSGAIVIEGLQRHIPALARMRERIVILRQRPATGDIAASSNNLNEASNAPDNQEAVEDAAGNPCRPELALHATIDGVAFERFAIGRGEQQFFRIVNASASRYFDLSIDGVPLQLVALDGVPLDAYPGARAVLRVDHLTIAPAGRAEFVVTGPGAPALLRSRCVDSGPFGDAQPASILGALDVDAAAAAIPRTLVAAAASLPRNVLSEPPPPPIRRRTVRLTEDADGFRINGRRFDMKAMMGPPAFVARAGTIEAWDVVNDTDEVHDFHVHQVHFAQTSLNGVPLGTRHWMDTVSVPARVHHWKTTTPAWVRLLVDFRNPVVRGRFVFHCHILDHEDRGMMAAIEVR